MKIPLGAIIRRLAPPGSLLHRIFSKTKGVTISGLPGGVEIELEEKHGLPTGGGKGAPHRPGGGFRR